MQSAERTTDVLLAIADAGGDAGVSEICRALALGKATVHRILQSLVEKGMVSYLPDSQRYRLGGKVVYMGLVALDRLPIRTEARPYLRKLCDLTGQHAHLLLPMRDSQIVVDTVRGPGPVSRMTAPAMRPIHLSAAGKAMLAHSATEFVDQYLAAHAPFPRLTPHSIVGAAEFRAELESVRARGFAVSVEEAVIGSAGLAFPLINAHERLLGAIEVFGPADTWTRARIEELAPTCRRVLEALNLTLSYLEPSLL